jgi:hypothetical protein
MMACSSGGDGEDPPPICARREALTVGLTAKAADQLRKIRGLYSQRLRPPGSPADTPDEFHSLLSRAGTLSHLSGKYLSVPVPVPAAATPDQVALSFLKTYPDLHGVDLASSLFVVKQAVALPTGDVNVVLQQYTNGVKVLGAEVRMMVSPQREVRSYHGRSSPDIALPAKPVVSSAKALQVAAANSPAAVADQVELVYLDPDITTFSNQQHLAWRHQAHDASTSWVSYVDAVTGDLIVKKDSKKNVVPCRRLAEIPQLNDPPDLIHQLQPCQGGYICACGSCPGCLSSRQSAAWNAQQEFISVMNERYGRDGYDGQGSPMTISLQPADDPEYVNHAEFLPGQPAQVNVGVGCERTDVIAHEWAHGLFGNLEGDGVPEALGEGLSDLTGVFVEGTDWEMGCAGAGTDPSTWFWRDLQTGVYHQSTTTPAVTALGNEPFVFWKDAGSTALKWVRGDNPNINTLSGSATSSAPSATTALGRIWLVYRGVSENRQVYVRSFDGETWSAVYQVDDPHEPQNQTPVTDETPEAVYYSGRIWVVYPSPPALRVISFTPTASGVVPSSTSTHSRSIKILDTSIEYGVVPAFISPGFFEGNLWLLFKWGHDSENQLLGYAIKRGSG